MDSYIKNTGNYSTVIDGNIVDQAKWNVVYDGNDVNLEAHRNYQVLYMKLSNDDIIKLLEIPASNYTMDKRILQDRLQHIPVDPIIIRSKVPTLSNTKKEGHHLTKSLSKKKSRSAPSKKRSRSGPSKKKSRSTTRRSSKSRRKEEMVPEYLRTIY